MLASDGGACAGGGPQVAGGGPICVQKQKPEGFSKKEKSSFNMVYCAYNSYKLFAITDLVL